MKFEKQRDIKDYVGDVQQDVYTKIHKELSGGVNIVDDHLVFLLYYMYMRGFDNKFREPFKILESIHHARRLSVPTDIILKEE